MLSDVARIAAVERHAGRDTATQLALDELTAIAAEVLSVPVVLVSLVDDTRQVFKGMCGLPEPWGSRRQTGLSHSFCRTVTQTAEPLIVEDARSDPRVAGNLAIRDLSVVGYAGYPIADGEGRVLGSFCAIDTEPRRWTATELSTVERFARVAQHTLFAAIEQGRAQLDEVEGLSRRLQRALRPTELPSSLARTVHIAYQPGTQRMLLGGDFVDVLEHDDGTIGFVLGDVCGHGPEAAALAIELRAIWSAIEAERNDLATLARRLNAIAWRRNRDSLLFATAVFGRVDPARRAGVLVCAGHEPPLTLDARASPMVVQQSIGLGMVEHGAWYPSPVGLGARGMLAYTDGLIEGLADGATSGGERFGVRRLAASVTSWLGADGDEHSLAEHVIRDATAANGDELSDDVAVLHIRGGSHLANPD